MANIGVSAIKLIDSDGDPLDDGAGKLNVNSIVSNSLVPSVYDYISLTYNAGGNVATATYKTGGSGGTTVAVLTLAYSGSNLTTVTKTSS